MSPPRQSWLAPVDGIRAVAHLGVIGLHAVMLSTAPMPGSTQTMKEYKGHPIISVLTGGGVQVDYFLMLSGFLLTLKLVGEAGGSRQTGIVEFVVRRVARMWPAMIFALALGRLYGDVSEPTGYGTCAAVSLLFVQNLLDPNVYVSFTTGPLWSNAVDMQCGVVLFLIIAAARWLCKDPLSTAKSLRLPLLGIVGFSIAVRSARFTPDACNLIKQGEYGHYRQLLEPVNADFIADMYNHTWRAHGSAVAAVHDFLRNMYFSTETRCGPYAVGALLACNLIVARDAGAAKPGFVSFMSYIAACVFSLLAVGQMVAPLVPPGADDAPLPIEAQHGITVALRVMAAAAAACLLYRALVPEGHAWSSPWLRSALSLKVFSPLAAVSYASYCLHFRIVEFFALYETPLFALRPADDQDGTGWAVYTLAVWAAATATSLAIATAFHYAVERPVDRAVRAVFAPVADEKKTQ